MKKKDDIDELYELLNSFGVTSENIDIINEVKKYIQEGEYKVALRILKEGIDEKDLIKKEDKTQEIEENVENVLEEDRKSVGSGKSGSYGRGMCVVQVA